MIRLKPGFPVSFSEHFRIFEILPTIIRSIVNITEVEILPTVLKDSSNRQGFFQLSKKILPTIKDSSNRARKKNSQRRRSAILKILSVDFCGKVKVNSDCT